MKASIAFALFAIMLASYMGIFVLGVRLIQTMAVVEPIGLIKIQYGVQNETQSSN